MSATFHLAHAATLAAAETALSNTLTKVKPPLWASYRGERARCQLACKERRFAGDWPLLRSRCGDGDGHVVALGWGDVESRAGLFVRGRTHFLFGVLLLIARPLAMRCACYAPGEHTFSLAFLPVSRAPYSAPGPLTHRFIAGSMTRRH